MLPIPAALALGLALASEPAIPHDWMGTAQSEGGVTVEVDERAVAFLAALNALGYDVAPIRRAEPVPARELTPLRARERDACRLPPELAAAWQKAFDADPRPVAWWLDRILAGGPEEAPESGLGRLLQASWDACGRDALDAGWPEVRGELAATAQGIDKALAAAFALGKLGKPPAARVVVNPLDALGRGYALGGTAVTGPGGLRLAVAQLARAAVLPAATKVAGRLKEGALLLDAARAAGGVADDGSVAELVADSVGRALAITATGGGEAEAQEQAHLGFLLVPELVKAAPGLDRAKGLEPWLAEALARVDARKLAGPRSR